MKIDKAADRALQAEIEAEIAAEEAEAERRAKETEEEQDRRRRWKIIHQGWPASDDYDWGDEDDGYDPESALEVYLLARFQARPEKANEYARAGLFKECNDKLANDFAAQWPEDDFNRAFVHAVEMVFMDARDNPKLLKALQVGKKTARHVLEAGSQRGGAKGAGRPMTDQTLRIDRIMKAAKVNRRRAYEIDLDGTGIRWQRLALAAEFEKDPARCVPAFWELANGSRPGRMASGLTFRAYVESGADQFEDAELGDVLTLLAAMYERGEPPDHFRTLEDFTNYFAVRLGLNAGHVFTLWGRYQKAKAN